MKRRLRSSPSSKVKRVVTPLCTASKSSGEAKGSSREAKTRRWPFLSMTRRARIRRAGAVPEAGGGGAGGGEGGRARGEGQEQDRGPRPPSPQIAEIHELSAHRSSKP